MNKPNLPRLLSISFTLMALVLLPSLQALSATIVIYGASGRVGSIIVNEALERGHDVIGVSRNPESLKNDHPRFSAVAGDATKLDSMLDVINGSDIVIFSLRGIGPGNTPQETTTARAAAIFIQAAEQLADATPHAIHVGGGATLWRNGIWGLENSELKPGTARHGQYHGHWTVIETYQSSENVKWTVMTPPPGSMTPGERTGNYGLGRDEILVNAKGEDYISTQDFAVAIIDEAETGKSMGKRVAVGPRH
jgi:putative NADH-flavin reductase